MTAASLSVPLLGIVDTAILGHLEHMRFLAAVAAGSAIMGMIYWLFAFLRMGNTGLTAQAGGREDWQATRQYLFQSVLLAWVLGLLLTLLQHPLLTLTIKLIDPSPEVAELALSYCRIRIFSAPATLASYALVGWLLGLQRPRHTLIIMLVINLLNIALDFIFILGLGLNSNGAAWASFAAEWIGLAIALVIAFRQLQRLPGTTNYRQLLQLEGYRSFFTVNRHLFARTALLLLTMTFFTAQGARLGDDILAANAILMQLLLTVAYFLDGFAHAAETLIGHAIGANKPRQFYNICRQAALWTGAISLTATGIFWLWPAVIIGLFTDLEPVFTNALRYWPWLVALPMAGFPCFLMDGVYIGGSKTRAMQNLMALATLGVFLPCWYLTRHWGGHGLWFAYLSFLSSRSVMMTVVFFYIDRGKGWIANPGAAT